MTVSLYGLAFDCADAAELAGFWAGVLGRSVDEGATSDFAAIGMHAPDRGSAWLFQKVPDSTTTGFQSSTAGQEAAGPTGGISSYAAFGRCTVVVTCRSSSPLALGPLEAVY